MRIARVLTRLNLGGPARQVLASDPLLVERGHEVHVFAGRPEAGEGDLFDLLRSRGVTVERVPGLRRSPRPWNDLRASRALGRAFDRLQPDVVHTHASKAGTLGRRAAFRRGLPTVHTFHGHVLEGYFPDLVSKRLIEHERRLAARTDRVLAVAHATAEDLLRLGVVQDQRLTVVPPGIDLDPFLSIRARSRFLRRMIGAPEEAQLVGVIGRLASVKRPELALEVFELLAARHRRMHLVFVGDGAEFASLARRIRGGNEDVQQRVHLVGAQENMVAVMSDLDLVLLTSRSEGAPVCLLEAAASSVPVVASDVGGVQELVAHERTGWLGETVDEWAFGVDQLLSDERVREGTGQRARLRVRQRHSATALADRLEGVYQAVLEEREATP